MSFVNLEINSPKFLPRGSLTYSEQTVRRLVSYQLGQFIEWLEVTKGWMVGSGELLLHGYRVPIEDDERVLEIDGYTML